MSEKYHGFILKFAALMCAFAAGAVFLGYSASRLIVPPATDQVSGGVSGSPVIVIDPGHGGEDGGAVAADGTLEKDLNLELSSRVSALFGVLGIDSRMTRDTDVLLYDKYSELDDYTGKKKVYDLKNRLRFTEESGDDAVFLGIHMNRFADPKYNGTQVYYSPNSADSRVLAEAIRTEIKTALQPDNTRETKKAGSSIFLLKRLKVPAVLVECGFLSNEGEAQRLKDPEYQKAFAAATVSAVASYISSGRS